MKNKSNQTPTDVKNILYTAVAFFGGYILNTVYIASKYVMDNAVSFIKNLWLVTDRFRKWLISILKRFGIFISKPFMNILRYFALSYKEAKGKNLRKGFFFKLSFVGRLLFGKKGIVVFVFNAMIPVISIFFLFSVVSYASSVRYAVKLSVNGIFLGYIENEQVFLDAQDVLNNRLNYLGGDVNIEVNPSYSIEKISYSETLNKHQIADLILRNSGVSLDYGYGFFINNVFYGALKDYSKVKNTLESLLNNYKTSSEEEKINFVDNVKYDEAGLYLTKSIIDENWLIGVLTGTKSQPEYYVVTQDDDKASIIQKTNLDEEQLEELNPGFSEAELDEGDKIKTKENSPFLSVSVTRTEVYVIDSVPFDTETFDDPNTYIGNSREVQEGVCGQNRITADVTYVNGLETGRNITQVVPIKDPVTKIVAVGTKPTPEGTFINSTAAYGKFIWPLKSGIGEISQWSYWDGGYTRPTLHYGIDIAGIPYGEPVYAGASGIVTKAGWSDGLGYYVSIYHEDLGLTTTYGHNAMLFVKKGQRVSQGECIAGAGSTGYSTGIHVHFAVQLADGTNVNPKPYLDIPPWVRENLV